MGVKSFTLPTQADGENPNFFHAVKGIVDMSNFMRALKDDEQLAAQIQKAVDGYALTEAEKANRAEYTKLVNEDVPLARQKVAQASSEASAIHTDASDALNRAKSRETDVAARESAIASANESIESRAKAIKLREDAHIIEVRGFAQEKATFSSAKTAQDAKQLALKKWEDDLAAQAQEIESLLTRLKK